MRRCSLYFPSSVITFLIAKGKSFLKRRNGQRALRPTQAVLRPGQRAQRLRWCIASIVHLYSRSFFSGPTNAHSWVLKKMTDRKSTRLNSSHGYISYAVFCLKKKKKKKKNKIKKKKKKYKTSISVIKKNML